MISVDSNNKHAINTIMQMRKTEMRDIIEKLGKVDAMMEEYRNSFLSEEDIADLTDADIQYDLVGEVLISDTTTNADIDAAVANISKALWSKN